MLQVQIVTYNSEDALSACLDSLLLQSLPPDRVVVIDNASTDQTKQVITGYEHSFHAKNIAYETLFLSFNSGYAAGHNQGIHAASTHQVDFLCTLNPDVRMEPVYLQMQAFRGQNDEPAYEWGVSSVAVSEDGKRVDRHTLIEYEKATPLRFRDGMDDFFRIKRFTF